MEPNRRVLLKAAVAGGAVALVPAGFALGGPEGGQTVSGHAGAGGHGGHAGAGEHAAAGQQAPAALGTLAESEVFAHPMPLPRVLRPVSVTARADVYAMRMREAETELVKGVRTRVRTYDGSLPGPTLRAFRDREVIIRQYNDLPVRAAVHLHGGHVPSAHDGLPMDVIEPGAYREYRYPNTQRAASLWYHDHAHHLEAENVYRGLHGTYLLGDAEESALPLPRGRYDVPLVIRDARVEADGTLTYTRPDFCPHLLVNGKERPYFEVAARRYRFRLFNVSVNRHITLRLADGSAFQQIATDGGLLEAPVERTEITLAGAERAEIVVDFSRYRVGSSLVLENTAATSTERPEVLRFDIVRTAPDLSRVPRRLSELPPVPTSGTERAFVLDLVPRPQINGLQYDPERVDVETVVGSTEIWTIRNGDAPIPPPNFHVHHSFHTHLVQFRVLDRNGVPVGPGEAGLKDTVVIAPGDTVRIAMTWGDYTGQYVYHCHQLGHSSAGQMGRIDVRNA
ncbi:multicopper oxidase family protein [Streptomyces sp. NPDC057680]|uniref:multicopper oxidase family protein n=1 Tax=Streptomyces sp. NPDC057680 TaxID=3346208 RepID=UPI0036A1D842